MHNSTKKPKVFLSLCLLHLIRFFTPNICGTATCTIETQYRALLFTAKTANNNNDPASSSWASLRLAHSKRFRFLMHQKPHSAVTQAQTETQSALETNWVLCILSNWGCAECSEQVFCVMDQMLSLQLSVSK